MTPAWIADAHARVRTRPEGGEFRWPAHGAVGDRTFEAHPTCTDDGDVMWWLVDDTDRRLAEDALKSERERTAFLAGASSALLSSLNVERCMEVTARLAAEPKKATPAQVKAFLTNPDPDKRAAYDARRVARKRPTSGPTAITDSPKKKEVMPRPPALPGEDSMTIPARCSLTGDTFQLVVLRAKGPFERFRVIGFEPGGAPPSGGSSPGKPGFFSRIFGSGTPHPLDQRDQAAAGHVEPLEGPLEEVPDLAG